MTTTQDEIRDWLTTVPYKLLAAEFARRANAKRKTHAGGRPKVLKPCPRCKSLLGARELARHAPHCTA